MIRLWKVFVCVCMFCCIGASYAQVPQYAFRISFKDKSGSPSLSNPLVFLSQRSLDRRTAQGIALDSTDQPVSPVYVNDVLATVGSSKFHSASKWLNSIVILTTDSSQILTLSGKTYVTDIKYVGYFFQGLHKTAQLGSGNKTTGGRGYYGTAYDQTELVNGSYLHDRGYKGKGKLIAILDEGFLGVDTGPAFDSMRQAGRLVDAYNFVYANSNVYANYDHGTACLSTMAGNMPGVYVGAAPEASYALYVSEYRFGDYPVEMDDMAAANERADSVGADVISASLGYNYFSSGLPSLTLADIDGKTTVAAKSANIATAKGMLYVITAGNEGGNSWNKILTPGDADSALTVGSVSNAKEPYGTSGFGPNAAGVLKPDVCLQGAPASVMFNSATPSVQNGTSFSTPQMAGWAACLWQANKNTKPYQLRDAIRRSAHMYNTPGNQIGYGVPNFYLACEFLKVLESPEALSKDNWVTIAPNPADETVQLLVYLNAPAKTAFKINDANGKTVYVAERDLQYGKQAVELNIAGLSKGLYFLTTEAGNQIKSIRFIKQ